MRCRCFYTNLVQRQIERKSGSKHLMKIGIGIDTGGTYTDAVVFDFSKREILSTAKALTTKEDLSLGIGNALDALQGEWVKKADIIALSTTLATNACVENKGGRAKLIFIGVDKAVVSMLGKPYGLPDAGEMLFVHSVGKFNGEIVHEPDWEAFSDDCKAFLSDAEAVGVVEIYAINSSAVLEKKAKELLEKTAQIPVICGHELFSDLNSIQRGSSTLLNARLIPVIASFLSAIQHALALRGITAPVVIVRSDGTLMSEGFTCARPVETLLCGPAASVMGGVELTNEQDCLVVDMGGTTTDIAIVKRGVPVKATLGIDVGKWRTFVKGLSIDTFGLGGDSAVRYKDNKLVLEENRVMPLCVAAQRWPVVTRKLQALVHSKRTHDLYLHEFFAAVKDISRSENYNEREKDFCAVLKKAPLSFTEAAAALRTDIYGLCALVARLEKEGVVLRCALTPTDIMHIKGDFDRFDAKAARMGAEYVAACLKVDVDALCADVYDAVKKKLYCNLVRILLCDQYPVYKKEGLGEGLTKLIEQSWEEAKNPRGSVVDISFSTTFAAIGIGAPIHIFLPDVARALGTRCVVPQNAAVANALGAVVGNICATCTVEVVPDYAVEGIRGYVVHCEDKNIVFVTQAQAIEAAKAEAERMARSQAQKRGAKGDLMVSVEVAHSSAPAKEVVIYLGTKVTATAIGRIAL